MSDEAQSVGALRAEGRSYREIARRLGIPLKRAWLAAQRVSESAPPPPPAPEPTAVPVPAVSATVAPEPDPEPPPPAAPAPVVLPPGWFTMPTRDTLGATFVLPERVPDRLRGRGGTGVVRDGPANPWVP